MHTGKKQSNNKRVVIELWDYGLSCALRSWSMSVLSLPAVLEPFRDVMVQPEAAGLIGRARFTALAHLPSNNQD